MNNAALPELEKELKAGNNKKYKVEAIIDSAVYRKEVKNQMPGYYYLVLWKGYPKEKST